jgi:hypothetical protein
MRRVAPLLLVLLPAALGKVGDFKPNSNPPHPDHPKNGFHHLTVEEKRQHIEGCEGNCWDGVGKLTFPYKHVYEGQTYNGEWREGEPHGEGRMDKWKDNTWYEGEWYRGRAHGQGKTQLPDGHHYVGEFERGLRHGQGTLHKVVCEGVKCWGQPGDGGKYVGGFRRGRFHGEGHVHAIDGTVAKFLWHKGRKKEEL